MNRRRTPKRPPELEAVVQALVDHKAQDLQILDLRAINDATDFFIVASGTSDIHVRALSEHVIEAVADLEQKPHHVEGLSEGRWVLLDFVDFVVHVFHPTLREFYQLERLWSDAPVLAAGHEA